MEAKEIKFELCKIALQAGAPMERVEQMYDWIIKNDEDKTEQKDISSRPISELLLGMGKYDKNRGFVTRFNRIVSQVEIKTIGDLLYFGKHDFSRIHSVGIALIKCVDDTLEELYGIKSW